jgi:hypothetical protein
MHCWSWFVWFQGCAPWSDPRPGSKSGAGRNILVWQTWVADEEASGEMERTLDAP